ncbi:MAG: hypothetical protein ACPGUZ_00925 [Holosporaceae bacterium]
MTNKLLSYACAVCCVVALGVLGPITLGAMQDHNDHDNDVPHAPLAAAAPQDAGLEALKARLLAYSQAGDHFELENFLQTFQENVMPLLLPNESNLLAQRIVALDSIFQAGELGDNNALTVLGGIASKTLWVDVVTTAQNASVACVIYHGETLYRIAMGCHLGEPLSKNALYHVRPLTDAEEELHQNFELNPELWNDFLKANLDLLRADWHTGIYGLD